MHVCEFLLMGVFYVISPVITAIGIWKWIRGGLWGNLILIPWWLCLLGTLYLGVLSWWLPEIAIAARKARAAALAQFIIMTVVMALAGEEKKTREKRV